ncbi:hypothetical protein [Photobacterium carnosum]|uniref:hypothetical protein n=1 Tax=Photobacterium carnosum TaxID=2023717 RepID=UPI001E555195|nr:hypothetical protein [Photobacterium carnosum]
MTNTTKDVFLEKIIKNKIKPPTRYGFSLNKWHKEWEKIKDEASIRDKKVFISGYIINSILSEICTMRDDIYLQTPKTTNEKLMLAYVAISNRDLSVTTKTAVAKHKSSIFGIKLDTNYMGNSITLQEISHGCVDGLQPAIRMCQKRIDDNEDIKVSSNPIDLMSFIRREIDLSQLYETYSHIWQCVFWSDYDFIQVDKEQKIYCFQQPATAFEYSFENSAIRRERLGIQTRHLADDPTIQAIFYDDKYVVIRKKGKKRVAEVLNVSDADTIIQSRNTYWQVTVNRMLDYYPEAWLTSQQGKGFAISEALTVMRCLMLMSGDLMDRFPKDDSAFSLHKLLTFCPTVQVFSLKLALVKATGLPAEKISNILDFMTFKANRSSDLWCQPLLEKSNNEYAISVSALISPVMTRVIEKWCVELGIDLGAKGYKYEQTVIEMLNKQLANNKFIQEYDEAISKRIRLPSGEEEFDLLVRIDDLIIIGEFKATLTVDSEIIKKRTADTLEYAGVQVKRKTKFMQENMEAIFERIGWPFDSTKQYSFAQCIVNSAQMFIGYKFNEVPVVDERILKAYFESKNMRLISVPSGQGGVKDIAWYELYADLDELKNNLQFYLSNPPQLSEQPESFEYNNIQLPAIHKNSFKIIQRRFVLKDARSPCYRMDQQHHFRVVKSEDYEEQIAQMDVTI